MFHFCNGPERRPRLTVENVPRLPQPPSTGPAREEVRVLVDGTEYVLEVIRARRIHGWEAYWRCGHCAALRWHLYLRDGILLCRLCHRLTYESRRRKNRAPLRAAKLRRKLGAAPSLLAPLPKRPKHWRRDYWLRSLMQLAAVERVLAARLHDMVRR